MEADVRPSLAELATLAKALRRDILVMLSQAGSGHPGASLSMVELLIGLYWYKLRHDPKRPDWPERDLFLLSKGHGCPALYAVLARRGYFDPALLSTLRKLGSPLQGHPQQWSPPGVEIAAGSLGQGLSMANGWALALKMDGDAARRVYCLLGDGEVQEGQVWEAAMTAGHYHLDHLCAIVDANSLQQNGPVKNIMGIEPLPAKWEAFGWHAVEIDGHNQAQVLDALDEAETIQGRPTVIVARTVKGKGVSFMENKAEWHGVAPKPDELERALKELA